MKGKFRHVMGGGTGQSGGVTDACTAGFWGGRQNNQRSDADSRYGGNVSAPGIFCDPCPTGGLLGGALTGAHLAQCSYLGVWLY